MAEMKYMDCKKKDCKSDDQQETSNETSGGWAWTRKKRTSVIVFFSVFFFIIVGLLSGLCVYLSSVKPVRSYEFTVSRDIQELGGRSLIVNTVNGRMQGPAIHVRTGDILSVRLTNMLPDHGLTLHWHGFGMRNAQVYDGPVGVTQCAVAPGESFLYLFTVEMQPGTYWWHTHSSVMPVGHNFVKGPLIIHERDADLTGFDEYSFQTETILFFVDLYPNYPLVDFMNTITGYSTLSDQDEEGFMIGSYQWDSGILNGMAKPFIPVTNGLHKFRVINGGEDYAYIFSIDGYELTVVAADGAPVEPYKTDVIYVHVGERFDVIVNFTITTDTQNVWIRASTLSASSDTGILGALQIRRDNTIEFSDKEPDSQRFDKSKARKLNCYVWKKDENCVPVTALKPLWKRQTHEQAEDHVVDILWMPPPSFAHLLSIDGGTWTQNILPTKPLLLNSTTEADIPDHTLLLPLPLNKSVTLVFRSKDTFHHAIHFHGYKFEVLEVATRKKQVCKKMCDLVDLESAFSTTVAELSRREDTGVLKDTVLVPAGGATAVRIYTDNPGVWLLHCHVNLHQFVGFSMVLDIGGYRESDLPTDFPSCDAKGRLQTSPTTECWCKEDTTSEERVRMKSSWKCSKPHLCRHAS